ncbi:MAG: hypothetical protein R3C70_15400 [Geminicoccaceae bacterium]
MTVMDLHHVATRHQVGDFLKTLFAPSEVGRNSPFDKDRDIEVTLRFAEDLATETIAHMTADCDNPSPTTSQTLSSPLRHPHKRECLTGPSQMRLSAASVDSRQFGETSMPEKRAFASIVVLGVASMMGQTGLAAFAGIALPLDRMLDAVFDRHERGRRQSLKTLCGCLADELDLFVPHDEGTREAVRLAAQKLFVNFGPDDSRFVEHYAMNAETVADDLLARWDVPAADRQELERHVRRVLTCFYRRLPEQAEIFADMLPHTQRAALQKLGRIEKGVDAIGAQVGQLVAQKEDQAREFGIKEGMLIALARRYAEGNPGDFDAAYRGL